MAFAKAQPICTFCRNLNYDQSVFYVHTYPPVEDMCCVCGKKRDRICYMRLDPMKVPYPKVRTAEPRKRGHSAHKHHR